MNKARLAEAGRGLIQLKSCASLRSRHKLRISSNDTNSCIPFRIGHTNSFVHSFSFVDWCRALREAQIRVDIGYLDRVSNGLVITLNLPDAGKDRNMNGTKQKISPTT
jgi:hypothetical protein